MEEDETGQDPKSPPDVRLGQLEKRLERLHREEAIRTGKTQPNDANEQLGQRVLSYLIGGLAGGALIGWVLDRIFGTGHLLLVVLMVLGTVGGFWSIFKIANRRQ